MKKKYIIGSVILGLLTIESMKFHWSVSFIFFCLFWVSIYHGLTDKIVE